MPRHTGYQMQPKTRRKLGQALRNYNATITRLGKKYANEIKNGLELPMKMKIGDVLARIQDRSSLNIMMRKLESIGSKRAQEIGKNGQLRYVSQQRQNSIRRADRAISAERDRIAMARYGMTFDELSKPRQAVVLTGTGGGVPTWYSYSAATLAEYELSDAAYMQRYLEYMEKEPMWKHAYDRIQDVVRKLYAIPGALRTVMDDNADEVTFQYIYAHSVYPETFEHRRDNIIQFWEHDVWDLLRSYGFDV